MNWNMFYWNNLFIECFDLNLKLNFNWIGFKNEFLIILIEMSYQLYRNTTLGHTLQETLDEFIQVCPQFGPKLWQNCPQFVPNLVPIVTKSKLIELIVCIVGSDNSCSSNESPPAVRSGDKQFSGQSGQNSALV